MVTFKDWDFHHHVLAESQAANGFVQVTPRQLWKMDGWIQREHVSVKTRDCVRCVDCKLFLNDWEASRRETILVMSTTELRKIRIAVSFLLR